MIVDTSFLYAYYNSDDTHHNEAMNKLKEFNGTLIISDYILGEMLTLFLYKKSLAAAHLFIETVYDNEAFEVIHFSPLDFQSILETFKSQKRQLSFIDASVVYLAKTMNLDVLTFDQNILKEIKTK